MYGCRHLSFQSYWQTCWSRIGKGFSCRKHTLATRGQWWTLFLIATLHGNAIIKQVSSFIAYLCCFHMVYYDSHPVSKTCFVQSHTCSSLKSRPSDGDWVHCQRREFQSVVALTFTFTTSNVDWTTLTSARVDMCMCAPAPNCSIKIDSGGEWFAL